MLQPLEPRMKPLTRRQRALVDLIEFRRRWSIPTAQRDLAEHLGIRRDTLNKLLARTRRRLEQAGQTLVLPGRRGQRTAAMVHFDRFT